MARTMQTVQPSKEEMLKRVKREREANERRIREERQKIEAGKRRWYRDAEEDEDTEPSKRVVTPEPDVDAPRRTRAAGKRPLQTSSNGVKTEKVDETDDKQAAEEDTKPAKRAKTSSRKSSQPSKADAEKADEDADTKVNDEPSDDANIASRQPRSRTKKAKGPSEKEMNAGAEMAQAFQTHRDAQREEPSPQRASRGKANQYGLSPGISPFPKYAHPTPEECQNVKDILAKKHGDIEAPKTVPKPSLNSSGCGEVPSVLDALIRTRLSAATNNANSSRAFKGLVETFGLLKSGVGKGSVDWNKVRNAPQKQVFQAIQSGGLADVKSRDIKKILDMVHEENQERRENLQAGKKAGNKDADAEDDDEKKVEMAKASENVLSLDHLHLLSSEDAFQKLLGYPGIGPKTASCVLLFCMQRPSFAVDTHVFRLTKWLGWVPTDQKAKAMANAEAKENGTKAKSATVTREKTYAHLDVRIPDELKYPLHYLLIKHGKHCGFCSAKAGAAKKVGTCPLAHLMSGKGRNKGLAKQQEDGEEYSDEEDDIKEEEMDEDEEDAEDAEDAEDGDDADVKDEEMHGVKVER